VEAAGGERWRPLRHETPSTLPSAALAAIFAVAMASTTVSTPIYPLYEVRFGLTALAITVVFAAYGGGVMGGLLVTGRLSDHIGRKPPLAAGLVIGLLAMALFVAANDLGLLLARRLTVAATTLRSRSAAEKALRWPNIRGKR